MYLASLSVLVVMGTAQGLVLPELTDANFESWKVYFLPKAEEAEFCEVPWRASFWQGVLDANKADKPILLWAMNGHPLGCT